MKFKVERYDVDSLERSTIHINSEDDLRQYIFSRNVQPYALIVEDERTLAAIREQFVNIPFHVTSKRQIWGGDVMLFILNNLSWSD